MVASYSPHRQHGETATLFSRPHSESPSSRHHVVLHSPTSCSSSFAITLSTSVKTRSATRRLTPLKSRATPTAPDSPIKFPLTLTTHNNMNSSGMTLRSGSSSPRAASPRDKLAAQRQNRAGIGVENKDGHKPSNGSPLKRSDGIMNLSEASRGSPVAKRRSQVGVGLFSSMNKAPTFGSPSFGAKSSPSPKRQSGFKKNTGQVFGDKPTWAKSRPQNRTEFMPPSNPASRMRRVTSVENFHASRDSPFGNQVAPLANPSIHLFNGNPVNNPHPLSQTFNQPTPQTSDADDFGPSSQNSNGLVTPQNYKTAKPFPAAFHSTGFVPKRGRLLNQEKDHGPQPDTPCKKPIGPPIFAHSAFQSKGVMGKSRGLSMSMTEFASTSSTPSDSGTGRWKLLARKTSSMSNDDGEDLSSSGEYELPPTPTKKFTGGLFGNSGNVGGNGVGGNKRLRTDTSAEGLRGRYVTNTPHTPRENIVPPDLSSVSISGRANNASKNFLPATPSPSKENFPSFMFSSSSTTTHAVQSTDGRTVQVSDNFVKRFSEVKHIGSGQFSEVYQVTQGPKRHPFIASLDPPLTPHQLATPRGSSIYGSSPLPRSPRTGELSTAVYAVKKSKSSLHGDNARARRMEEADILKELGQHDHVVEFFGSWEDEGHLYIQTEFCENGSLDKFLEQHGDKGRLDEFRVWKVLLELCSGLQHIHNAGIVHLDIKPANVLITFEGALKISDFGMAARWPVSDELEREGDREYIAPEVISHGKYDKPVDIFALGLTIIEAAGNETLPPNGPEWQSLREGDISVAPILSTSSSGEFVHRDEQGNPVATEMVNGFLEEPSSPDGLASPTLARRPKPASDNQLAASGKRRSGSLLHKPRSGDLVHPPKFMEEGGLEDIVKWMIKADPDNRPTVSELLDRHELQWVDMRRRAAATVFEGLWGPDDSLLSGLSEDEDMVGSQSASSEVGNYNEDWRMEM